MISIKNLAKQSGLSIPAMLATAKEWGWKWVADQNSEIHNYDILRMLEAHGKKDSVIYDVFKDKMDFEGARAQLEKEPPEEPGEIFPKGEEWHGIAPFAVTSIDYRFASGKPPIGNIKNWERHFKLTPMGTLTDEQQRMIATDFERKAAQHAEKRYDERLSELQAESRDLKAQNHPDWWVPDADSQEFEAEALWADEFATLARLWKNPQDPNNEAFIWQRLLHSGPWLELVTPEMARGRFLAMFISDMEARWQLLFRFLTVGDQETAEAVVESLLNVINSLNAEGTIPEEKLSAIKRRMLAWPRADSNVPKMGDDRATILKEVGKDFGQGMDTISHKQPSIITTQISIALVEFMHQTRSRIHEMTQGDAEIDVESAPEWVQRILRLPPVSRETNTRWVACARWLIEEFYPIGLAPFFPETFKRSPEPEQQFDRIKSGVKGILAGR